jgi:peptidoglycan/xylan/chitin deacetylase (PgdA/CDA1 family)
VANGVGSAKQRYDGLLPLRGSSIQARSGCPSPRRVISATPLVKSLAKAALHSLGGIHGFRLVHRQAARILMYHHFSPDTQGLKRQCEHIQQYYRPISLQRLSEGLEAEGLLPPNALAVTVDDGYRDFLFHGQPVFREYEIPVTVYLVSDFLDGRSWLWWNRIEYMVSRTARSSLRLETPRGELLSVAFDTDEQRRSASRKIAEALKGLENSERLEILDLLPKLLDVEVPGVPPPEWEALKWDEVRTLSREGVEFGAHTKTHPILSSIKHQDQQREEIEGSRRRIEAELRRSVLDFCYPNGLRSDFDGFTLNLLKDCGFRSATTTERGMNRVGTDPFLLRRLGVEPNLSQGYFAELLAGVRRE